MKTNTTNVIKGVVYALLTLGVMYICAKMAVISRASTKTVQDTLENYAYDWNPYENGCTALNFAAIYYIDTVNMCIYYDDVDQFDMNNEYDLNPDNINEDSNLIIHISKENLVELMNRILQWMGFIDGPSNEALYIQSMFGIKQIDGKYWVVYLGKV